MLAPTKRGSAPRSHPNRATAMEQEDIPHNSTATQPALRCGDPAHQLGRDPINSYESKT
jgi:hypothetical protein